MAKRLIKTREGLIHQAATQDADGVKWRDRLDRWLVIHAARVRTHPITITVLHILIP